MAFSGTPPWKDLGYTEMEWKALPQTQKRKERIKLFQVRCFCYCVYCGIISHYRYYCFSELSAASDTGILSYVNFF